MKTFHYSNAKMTGRTTIAAMAWGTLVASAVLLAPSWAVAQQTTTESIQRPGQQPAASNDQAKLFDALEKKLSGCKFVGNFTTLGQDDSKLMPEEYHIESARKMQKGNFWMFRARIKYAGKDVSVPMPLEIEWAGDTPVITLTQVAIPFLGTYSARVLIYNDKYAGTWSGGNHGGHLFGTIVPDQAEAVDVEKTRREQKEKGNSPKDK